MPKKKDDTKKCTRLIAIQKKSIQEKKKDNPNLKDEEIAIEFNCDRTLEIWIGSAKQQNLIITGDIIRQKALQFATLLGLYNHQIHRESESAPIEFLPQFREELKVLLAAYELQNIFNANECGLYYCMDPKYTLSTTAKSDGTEKLAPLVINTSKMPNAFRDANITSHNQLPIDYYHNESAWMCQDIFQPMDAGIINAFKAHYKCDYIHKIICDFDIGIEELYKIDAAWDTISAETIKNCCRHTRILPSRHLDKIFPEFEMMIEDIETQNIQVSEVIVEAQDIIDLTHDTDI
ncbi:12309_t:CDS:2 [Gigaspora margarita]|uniref:12309_t:CDS:1 n=1 Tax=Gigaspora margarita TaxID=4874 RepID=A0ABM8W3H9_GIGMA|nr:12309_t:CDS:2 [Gigaspora margarita]